MADIRDLVEKWDGHTGNEVEKFLKQEIGKRQESLRLGAGLGWDEGKLAVRYGKGLTSDSQQGLRVDVGSLVSGGRGLNSYGDGTMGVNVGRGLKIESCQVVVDKAVMTEVGKISGKQDRLSVSDGLKLANSVLKLKLSTSYPNINTSGLGYDDNGGLMVTVSTGLGIDRKIDGRLYIRCGSGITCNTDNDLTVRYGSGLDVLDGKLVLHEDIYYRLDSAEGGIDRCRDVITNLKTAVGGKQDKLTLATGLEWGKTDMIQVKMNAPLNYDNCGRLKLDYDSTLTVSNYKLSVNQYGIINNEGGLTLKNNGLAVNAGGGLKIDSCQVVVNYGTGLKVVNNKLDVDTSKIAGVGIDLDSDYKMLTIGTKAAKELAGTGLVADGPKMKVKYGSGLTTNSCGNLIVDAEKLTVRNATNATYLDGIHANYYTPRDRSVNGKDMNAQKESAIYMGYNMNNSAVTEISSFLVCRYSDDWGAQMQFSLVSGKVYVRFWQNAGGIMGTWKELAYKDGTVARATADANGNKIVETYAKRFMPTNGLGINNDRELFLPNLTSTLAGNAVDGSKNGAQRVLNLSCGAIQIKLSTGLAIDEGGYLYIQDKYVTK